MKLKNVIQIAALVAIEIILSRFCSIATPIMKIGFGFAPIVLCAILFGPLPAGIAAGVADVIGALLFPIGGYFPGYTLTAVLNGLVYGFILYKRKPGILRSIVAAAVAVIFLSLGLNTLWISMTYGEGGFFALLPTRLVQAAVLLPLQALVIQLLNSNRVRNELQKLV